MTVNALFTVVAEPNRRRILDLLRDRERPVGELVQALDVAQPTVSKHLKVLREVGLVEFRVEGRRRVYTLRAEPLFAVDAWLAPYRVRWARRLEALERHLETMPDEGDPA
ncbi:MAG TPA: metalloregulator ArsR/SmtB family transcription factor [Actinomycetota bacterium]|nr:metalloregulator ArsR/SmtB family transcription factor [Actinomycetota bacterium]